MYKLKLFGNVYIFLSHFSDFRFLKVYNNLVFLVILKEFSASKENPLFARNKRKIVEDQKIASSQCFHLEKRWRATRAPQIGITGNMSHALQIRITGNMYFGIGKN